MNAPEQLCESQLEVTVHQGQTGLEALRVDWESLVAKLPGRRFFHLYGWYHSYLATLSPAPETMRFLAIRRHGAPVAIIPLELTSRPFFGLRLRTLQVPLHPHVSLTDFVLDKTADNVPLMRQLLAYLQAGEVRVWDALEIPRTLEDSAAASALARLPGARQSCALRRYSDYLTCRGGYDEIEQKMSSNFRRNLRRLRRRADELGHIEYRSSRQSGELERLFEMFLEVEASGWKGAEGQSSAIRCHPRIEAFYRSLIREYSINNNCAINLLLLDGKCIAGQFCLLTDGVLYILKIGYDEAFSQVAPGYLLLDEVLRHYADGRQVHSVSFVTNPPWTHLWRADSLAVHDRTVYNKTARGWLAYLWETGKHQVRALVRRPATEPDAGHAAEQA